MGIMIGQTISHYKILEKLGEGGMGVVYKAHDIDLDRDVALKFLPHDVSFSEEERARFKHEAKAASNLDHPNICTIYEVSQTPDGQMFIAMGYYEGTSLNKKTQKGRLDLEEAVGIAIQIAEGLQAAHEKGIVHRDIKSGNIIITQKGQVKILDFGLAHKSGLSRLTRTGTTVGTAPYMSPEQAKGEKVDQRSDLWSLGVVLYEMVTGRLPFRGEHEAAILYSVVNKEPKPLEVSVSGTSPELIHIIGRALEKDIAERYQSAAEMLVDLKRLKKETSRTGFKPVGSGTARSNKRRNTILMILSAGVLITAALVIVLFFSKRSAGINPNWQHRQLQIPFKDISYPGISGDGNWIAFPSRDHQGKWGLYLMNVNAGGPRFVTNVGYASWVDISADGSLILYYLKNPQTSRWAWYTIYSNGGDPKRIIQDGSGPRFHPDGKRVGYIRGTIPLSNPSTSGRREFWTVAIDGSDPRREFIDSLSLTDGSSSFCYSPNGRKVAWLRTFPEKYEEIIVRDLETGKEITLTSDKKIIDEFMWVREDQILYTSNKNGIFNVWMVPASGGESVQITKGTEPALGVKSSADGQRIIYMQKRPVTDFWIVNVAESRAQQITFTEENQYAPDFSPDGRRIAFIVGGSTGYSPSHLFVMDRDGSNRRQVSSGDEIVSTASWSPDGRWVAYGSRKVTEPEDSIRTYVVEPSNPRSPKYIMHGDARDWLDSTRVQVRHGTTVYLTSVDGGHPVEVYDDSTTALFTPGGKYILYFDRHPGKDVGVWIVDGTKPRDVQRKTARLLPGHPHQIMVSGNGKFLYSIRGTGEILRMVLPDGKEERISADFLGVNNFDDFKPSSDGKEILIVKRRFVSNIVMIENLFK